MEEFKFEEEEFLACCGSTKFAKEMAKATPFSSLHDAVTAARDIWFNKVDVTGWLQAFSAHPQIGNTPSSSSHSTSAQFSVLNPLFSFSFFPLLYIFLHLLVKLYSCA